MERLSLTFAEMVTHKNDKYQTWSPDVLLLLNSTENTLGVN